MEAITSLQAVFSRPEFDPAKSSMTFRIACTDYAVACVLGPLMQKLAMIAPTTSVDVSPLVPASFAMLDSGEIDFALYATVNVKGDFIVQKLFDEKYSLVMRTGHPLLDCLPKHGAFEPEDLKGFPQIEFAYPTQEHLLADPVLRAEVGHVSSVFSIPFFTAMPFIIADTNAVAPVPARFAKLLSGIGGIETAPYRPSSGFPYHLIWHERARHNPAIRWLVEQVVAVMK